MGKLPTLPKISLEQWATFKAVVDEGSYARAAETLNKTQSTVSYTLSKMEALLPQAVLELEGRKMRLTEFGEALYRRASTLLEQATDLERLANYLASGWEAQVTLAIDAICPMPQVLCALEFFSRSAPDTRLRILETTLSGTDEALLLRQADVVITPTVPPGFLGIPLTHVTMRAAARTDHPLVQCEHPITENELRQHRQIVIRDSGVKREQNVGWLGSEQRWTVSHPATSLSAVCSGLGFAFLPEHLLESEIESGNLAYLNLERIGTRVLPLYLVHSARGEPGPAANAIANTLRATLSNNRGKINDS